MNEMQMYKVLRDVLLPLLRTDFPGATLIRNNQGTLQGVPTVGTVFMTPIHDKRIGKARSDFQFTPLPGEDTRLIPTTYVQPIETRMQFMSLSTPVAPEVEGTVPTATDILRRFAMYLSASAIIARLGSLGLNVLRIEEIRTPRFNNDHDTFQANPTFDVVFQHQDDFKIETHAVDAYEVEIHRV